MEPVAGERVAVFIFAEGLENQGQGHADVDVLEFTSAYLTHDADIFGKVDIPERVGNLEVGSRLPYNREGVQRPFGGEADGVEILAQTARTGCSHWKEVSTTRSTLTADQISGSIGVDLQFTGAEGDSDRRYGQHSSLTLRHRQLARRSAVQPSGRSVECPSRVVVSSMS